MARKTKQEEEALVNFIEEEETSQETLTMPTVDADFVEEETNEWYAYNRISLKELDDGDEYTGKPLLTPVETVTFDDDGTEQVRHRCRLILIDDEMEEYLQININLKQSGSIQKNVHHMSSLFKLIGSLQVCGGQKDWFNKNNRIRTIDLEDWEAYINNLTEMTIKVYEEVGTSFTYNSFKVIDTK